MPKRWHILRTQTLIGLLTAILGVGTLQWQSASSMVPPAAQPAREIATLATKAGLAQRSIDAQESGHAAPTRKTVALLIVAQPPAEMTTSLLRVVDQPDILPKHRMMADETLRKLPAACRNTLQTFFVNYDHPTNRGLGGASTMMIDGNASNSEYEALIAHECGHVIDLGGKLGTPYSGTSAFKDGTQPIYNNDESLGFYRLSWVNETMMKPGISSTAFVSGYARTDVFEDFAETFTFYALHRDQFQRLAKRNAILQTKYDWMAQHVFSSEPVIARSKTIVKNQPWDITKLGFAWAE